MSSRRFQNTCDERMLRQLIRQFGKVLSDKRLFCQVVNQPRQTYPIVPQDPLFPDYPESVNPGGQSPQNSQGPGSGQQGNQGQQQRPPEQLPPVTPNQPLFPGYPVPQGLEWMDQFSSLIYYVVSQIIDNVMTDVLIQGRGDLKDILRFVIEAFRNGAEGRSIEKIFKDFLSGKLPKSDEGNSSINGMQDEMLEKITSYVVLVFMFELVKWSQLWITLEIQQNPDVMGDISGGGGSNSRKGRGSHSRSGTGSRGRSGILQNILKAAGVNM